MLNCTRYQDIYETIKGLSVDKKYPTRELCRLGSITRAAYYKWLRHPKSEHELENEKIAEKVKKIHDEHPDMGYRRIRDELDRRHNIHVNDKRILHINRVLQIRSNIKFQNNGCTKNASSPECTADNVLNREFHADKPNEKWVTDVTEFKYGELDGIHKLYLSAILDLCDRRPVSFIISDHNNNQLVFDTFDAAVAANPDAHPLFHSDRGFQYTSRIFHQKLINAGMTQSMSRVAHCIDNGPMEGFWGILKREMYYGKRYTNRDQLVNAITNYMDYYTNKRLQRNLSVMAPMEYHEKCLKAA